MTLSNYNHQEYNSQVQSLLRHPQLDLLITEYPEEILLQEGMAYWGSNLVILEEPTEIEKMLLRDVLSEHRVIIQQEGQISVGTKDRLKPYQSVDAESFEKIYRHQSYQMLLELGFRTGV